MIRLNKPHRWIDKVNNQYLALRKSENINDKAVRLSKQTCVFTAEAYFMTSKQV